MPRARKAKPQMGRIAEIMASGGVSEPPEIAYQNDFCERLIKTYGLNCSADDLAHALIAAGDAYMRAGPLGYVPFRMGPETPELLDGISKTSRELANYLGVANNDDLFELLTQTEKSGARAGETRGMDGIWYPTKDDRYLKLHLLKLLRALERNANTNLARALAMKRPSKRGRPSQPSVEAFVKRLAAFWSRVKKKPFTVDYSPGPGGKSAVRFVIEAMKQMDTVPDTLIVTAARKVRKALKADKNSPAKG